MEKLIKGAKKLGITLSTQQIGQFETYYRKLVDWNQRMNLTSITDYEGVQVRHFLDSLTVATAVGERRDISVMDVGAGAGLPGIPLKILWPEIRLVLLEATAKKAGFLQHLIGELGLENVAVLVGRAEVKAHDIKYREGFDVVLSRAVAALPALAELTLPFCAVGGRFIAQKKGETGAEVEQASKAITVMGGSIREVKRLDIPELDDTRYLIVIDKVAATPEKYPRRPGIPAKRPIVS